jgi:hypothetical protein
MPAPTSSPADEARRLKDSLRFKIDNLRDEASMKSVIDEFTDFQTKAADLPLRIQTLRQRKYAFNGLLEKKAEEIAFRSAAIQGDVEGRIATQANMLQSTMRSIEMRFNALGALPSATMVQILSSETDQFEDRCKSTQNAISAFYQSVRSEVDNFIREIGELEYALDKVDGASFGFLPGEAIVKAVKTVWCKTGKEEKDDPEGVLFLTDQRLVFEQNEEVATKKVLFITTESQKVQQMLFEVPVVSIEKVDAFKAGALKNQDMLKLQFTSGVFARDAVLHIFYQDCVEWQQLISSVKTHEIDANRVIAVDKTAVEKAKAAPTQCPQCGGLITKPVLRGMDTITCEFCGKVIRL